jgi:flavin-binding protein dodecin
MAGEDDTSLTPDPSTAGGNVPVQKSVELTGTGPDIQQAVAEALDRAVLSLEGITSFEVDRIDGFYEGTKVIYRVKIRVWFTLMERMHG